MGVRLRLEAESAIHVQREQPRVWRWMNNLPDSLETFPMLKEAQELEPGQRYMLRIGKIRFGPLSTGIDCEVTVERSGQREIRFVSVPEQGNTDVRVVVDLAPDDSGDTCMTASLAVSPRKPLPKGAPVGFIQRTTNMALRLGLRRMLAKMRTVIESESFTQVA